jgi:hypothetical protein
MANIMACDQHAKTDLGPLPHVIAMRPYCVVQGRSSLQPDCWLAYTVMPPLDWQWLLAHANCLAFIIHYTKLTQNTREHQVDLFEIVARLNILE